MQFKDIIGHSEIKKRLIGSVKNNRISHAQLFLGSEGNGKLALAIAYAQYINCENPTENDSCGQCKSCKKFEKLIHPDLHFVFPVVKTNKIKNPVSLDYLEQWKNFLSNSKFHSYNKWLDTIGTQNAQGGIFKDESKEIIKIVNLKTFEAKYKIIIIYMPEKMNITAANKLLKAIEEPPPQTLFILVSEDESQILNTILSRTQLIKIPILSESEILEILKNKNTNIDEKTLLDIAKISNGNAVYAEEILNNEINQTDSSLSKNFEYFSEFMRLAYSLNFSSINNFVEKISSIGREKQKNFLEYSLRLLRENFIMNQTNNNEKLIFLTNTEKQFSQNFNKFITQNNIFALYDEFGKAHSDIIRNASPKILFLDLLLKTNILLKKNK